jgi:4-hydroxybenzoate polyprenyltransferase
MGVGLGVAIGTAHIIALHALGSLVYSIKAKELPLVDVFTLAFLYTLRVFGGAELPTICPRGSSPFSIVLFLSLVS